MRFLVLALLLGFSSSLSYASLKESGREPCTSLLSEEMIPNEQFDFTIEGVKVSFRYTSQNNSQNQASRRNFFSTVEEARKLLTLLLPIFIRSEPLTIQLSAWGFGGYFHPSSELAAPLTVIGIAAKETLDPPQSYSILKHQIGHMLLENRFFKDERLPETFRALAELQALQFEEVSFDRLYVDALWPMRFQQLKDIFSSYERPSDMSEAEFKNRLKDMVMANQRMIELREMRDKRAMAIALSGNRGNDDGYAVKMASIVFYSARFLAFSEFFANLVAQLFETSSGDFHRLIDFQARDQALNEQSRGLNGRSLEAVIQANKVRWRMLKGFNGFVTSDETWLQGVANLQGKEFQESVFAPLREWLGKVILPRLITDEDKVEFIKIVYEALITTFVRSGSINKINVDEVRDLNRIAIEEIKNQLRQSWSSSRVDDLLK